MDSAGGVFQPLTSRMLKLAVVLIMIGATPALAQDRYNSNGAAATSSNQACGPGVFQQGVSQVYEQAEVYQNNTWTCPPPQPGDMWLGVNGKNCTYEKPVPCGTGNSAPAAGPGPGNSTGNGSGASTGGGSGGSPQTSVEPQVTTPPNVENPTDVFTVNPANPPNGQAPAQPGTTVNQPPLPPLHSSAAQAGSSQVVPGIQEAMPQGDIPNPVPVSAPSLPRPPINNVPPIRYNPAPQIGPIINAVVPPTSATGPTSPTGQSNNTPANNTQSAPRVWTDPEGDQHQVNSPDTIIFSGPNDSKWLFAKQINYGGEPWELVRNANSPIASKQKGRDLWVHATYQNNNPSSVTYGQTTQISGVPLPKPAAVAGSGIHP